MKRLLTGAVALLCSVATHLYAQTRPFVTYMGTYNASITYHADDTVTYSGSTYIALAPNTNVTPGTNGADWTLYGSGSSGSGSSGGSCAGDLTGTYPNCIVSTVLNGSTPATGTALSGEVTRATGAEGTNATNITNLTTTVTGHTNTLAAHSATLATLGTAATHNVGDFIAPSGAATPFQTLSFDVQSGQYVPTGGMQASGLVGLYYFDARDAASGTTLYDHSGLGNNCTLPTGTTSPTYTLDNGINRITWPLFSTGATQALEGIECPGITNPVSIQIVTLYGQPYSAAYTRTLMGYSVAPGFELYEFAFASSGGGAVPKNSYGIQPTTYYGSTAPTGNGYNLVTLTMSNTLNTLYINDQPQAFIGASAVTPPTGGHLEIGTSHGTLTNANNVMTNASIYFMAVYNTPLSAAGVIGNYNYIKGRFAPLGINLGQTVNNGATPVPFNIVCGTTSIDAGTGGGSPPCNLMGLGSSYAVQISGIPSASMQQHNVAGFTLEKSMINPTSNNVLMLGGPVTNDIASYGATLAQAEAYTMQGIALGKSLGFQMGVGTLITRNATGFDTTKDAYNIWLRNAAASTGTWLMDMAAVPGLGADGASSNPTNACNGAACFVSDATHPTLAGEQVYALVEKNVILANTSYTALSPNNSTANAYTMTAGDRAINRIPTAAATDTLPMCAGLTGYEYTINNMSAFTITETGIADTITAATDTIVGSGVVAANSTGKFRVMLTSTTTGGCYWLRQ